MGKSKPSYHHGMFKGAPTSSFVKASVLRRNMTVAEKIFWERIRNKKLQGLKFRRQHPLHLYILDFYCHSLQLGIEIDGPYHDASDQTIIDEHRTAALEAMGISIVRFTNYDVENHIDEVICRLVEIIKNI